MGSPSLPSANRARLLAFTLLFGVLLGAVSGAVRSLLAGGELIVDVSVGVIGGLVVGILTYVGVLRRWRYLHASPVRDRGVIRPSSTTGSSSFAGRRYRMPLPVWVVAGVANIMFTGSAVSTLFIRQDILVTAGAWGLAALGWWFFATTALSFTDVSAEGIVVQTLARRERIPWPELVEVRRAREPQRDVLKFDTADGRSVTAAGVGVSRTGVGEQRMRQLQQDVEEAWSAALA